MKMFLFLALILPCLALAQVVEPAAPSPMSSIVDFLNGLANQIPTEGPMSIVLTFLGAGALDFLLRVKKTRRPLDLLITIGAILQALSKLCFKLSALIDRMLPQNSVIPKEAPKKNADT